MQRFVNFLAQGLGAVSTVLVAKFLVSLPAVPVGAAIIVGALVGLFVTACIESAIIAIFMLFSWGRSRIDPASIYHGLWLEDFGDQRSDKPYSVIRIIYDFGGKQYKILGTVRDAHGTYMGKFESNLVALGRHRRLMEGSYSGCGQESGHCPPFEGMSSITFSGDKPDCTWGQGHLYARAGSEGIKQFKVIRLTAKYMREELGIGGIDVGGDLTRHPDAEETVIRAYHAAKLKNKAIDTREKRIR